MIFVCSCSVAYACSSWFGLIRLHVDVDAVAEPHGRAPVDRLVALREELERELEVRLRLAAVRVNVAGGQRERRIRREQPAGFRREDVGVASDLVNRPAARRPRRAAAALALDDARVRHVVEDVAAADGLGAAAARDVVDLAHFDADT